MRQRMIDKLARHISKTSHYPPIITRPLTRNTYQILDGHHRRRALQQLNHTHARCLVWDVDDAQALVYLATLNRLSGSDNPTRRGQLLTQLTRHIPLPDITPLLPEDRSAAEHLIQLTTTQPRLQPPTPPEQQTLAVHFFLTPPQRQRLDQTLRSLGGSRSDALMKLVEQHNH
ncbi:ParB-like nuclease domain protein [Mucisphaera calidilacus]|uniref:ParB-like nuclease domain protein n=2 Tax=Mucisphaera calidilacus TaxID=2527982 RepID=A0A518C0P1_9BACT|nr:ParB-like nuclease domain protein [Mucisphaera calidilacus]